MIAHLSGNLKYKSIDSIVLDVNGVGYEVNVPLSTFYSLPDEGGNIELLIYTHVKEDVLKLFGFLGRKEKELFKKLLSVSGVGPKLALNILSGMETDALIKAIKSGDVVRMNSIPGVGKKTAERLILELKDKLKYATEQSDTTADISYQKGDLFDDTLSALTNLGYKRGDAEKAVDRLRGDNAEKEWTVEKLLKEALQLLVK
ncbi:MAG: Holliday junction branch migration protein RuvA [Proteobacteria bacterium]|nr:Holliday junction branch migration protein RuvA [Pseudomonadota bacterium]